MTRLLRGLCVVLPVLAGAASASPPPAEHLVTGFRSAHFGMGESEVRQAITRDLKPKPGKVIRVTDAAKQPTAFAVLLDSFEPGPGAAAITYLLDPKSHRLAGVNVVWQIDEPTGAQRADMAAAGVLLTHYFRTLNWRSNDTPANLPVEPGEIVLFAAVDSKGAGVVLAAAGVGVETDGKDTPPPSGPTHLHIAYRAQFRAAEAATEVPKPADASGGH